MEDSAPKKPFSFDKKQVDTKQIAIILGIALLLAAIMYIYLRVDEQLVVNRAKNQNTATASAGNSGDKTSLKFNQDQQRKNDVVMVNTALKSYYLEKKSAPQSLKDLTPNYLTEVPTDPVTSKEYKYTLSANQTSWTVSATLSDGNPFQAKGP